MLCAAPPAGSRARLPGFGAALLLRFGATPPPPPPSTPPPPPLLLPPPPLLHLGRHHHGRRGCRRLGQPHDHQPRHRCALRSAPRPAPFPPAALLRPRDRLGQPGRGGGWRGGAWARWRVGEGEGVGRGVWVRLVGR